MQEPIVVEFEQTLEECRKQQLLFWLYGSLLTWIIAGVIALLGISAAIVYGVVKNTQWGVVAIVSLIFLVVVLALRLFELPTYLRGADNEFAANGMDGTMKTRVSFDGQKYIFANPDTDREEGYEASSVIGVKTFKSILLVRFPMRQYIILPNTKELNDLFSLKGEEKEDEDVTE